MAIRKLRAIFKGSKQQESDVNDELRFHLERQIESNIAAGVFCESASGCRKLVRRSFWYCLIRCIRGP
jgi:hypothetical protein